MQTGTLHGRDTEDNERLLQYVPRRNVGHTAQSVPRRNVGQKDAYVQPMAPSVSLSRAMFDISIKVFATLCCDFLIQGAGATCLRYVPSSLLSSRVWLSNHFLLRFSVSQASHNECMCICLLSLSIHICLRLFHPFQLSRLYL